MASEQGAPGVLLSADEPGPFEQIEGSPDVPIVFVCDHASNRIPTMLGDLGVAEHHLRDHIAWDIGAEAVARRLAERFDASAVIANYSRLVIDLNRGLTDGSLLPRISDGVLVPGNLAMQAADRAARADALFHPYHDAIDALIETRIRRSQFPIFIGVHSFTPRFHGTTRPWHVGILWDRDPRLPLPMLQAMQRVPDIVIGNNEPYSGRHSADYSIDHHAESRGLAHVGIEIRQDLIVDTAGQQRWADLLGFALEAAIENESVFRPWQDRCGKP